MIMKTNRFSLLRTMVLAAVVPVMALLCMVSCRSEIVPEVSVPAGYVNYFIDDIAFSRLEGEVKVPFQINTEWKVKVVDTDDALVDWCHVKPASGDAGMHKVMVSVDANTAAVPRTARIQLVANDSKVAEIVVEQRCVMSSYTVGQVSFTMVPVKGGTFMMGATSEQGDAAYGDEFPAHEVTLGDFWIAETEVTQELWYEVMGYNPSSFIGDLQCPVERVNWNDCQTFISILNELTGAVFRLPTEAEWEYAARGGNASKGYKYSGSDTVGDVAWCGDNASGTTHPVKTKLPNELGIYDMSGNVWEWCADWYSDSYYASSPSDNPGGPASGTLRVLRGGCFEHNVWTYRVSDRVGYKPDTRPYTCGLRLAQ